MRHHVVFAWGALVWGLGASCALAQPELRFEPRSFIPNESYGFSLVAGDLNGDGYPDLVIGNAKVFVRMNLGAEHPGEFGPPVELDDGIVGANDSMLIQDVNDDGIPDLLVGVAVSNNARVIVYLGKPAPHRGEFEPMAIYPLLIGEAGCRINSFGVFEATGDGIPDLVVPCWFAAIAIFPGRGEEELGTFDSMYWVNGGTGRSTAVIGANVDRYPVPDLIVVGDDGESFNIVRGNHSRPGTFLPATPYLAGYGSYGVTTADYNGDGEPDLAVCDEWLSRIRVYIGEPGFGRIGFTPAGEFPVGLAPREMLEADFNGDGRADIATLNYEGGTFSIVPRSPGPGEPYYGATSTFPTHERSRAFAAADFDQDGRVDLAVAPFFAHGIQLYRNLTCMADMNGDDFLDFFDYDVFVRCFEGSDCPQSATADFNHDGFADFFDYADFVTAFEAGC